MELQSHSISIGNPQKSPKPCCYQSQSRTFTRMRGRMVIRWKAWSATKNTPWNIWSATIGWFLNADGAKWSNKIPEYPVSSPKQGPVSETKDFELQPWLDDLYLFSHRHHVIIAQGDLIITARGVVAPSLRLHHLDQLGIECFTSLAAICATGWEATHQGS